MRDATRDAMRDAMRDAILFFASLIASLKLRDAKFFSDRIPRANFRDAIEGCDPIASLIIPSLMSWLVIAEITSNIREIWLHVSLRAHV